MTEFEEVINSTYKPKEVADLAHEFAKGQFDINVEKVYKTLSTATDWLAEQTDPFVVAAALEILSLEWDEATGVDDDESSNQ
ncbi:hypothetical protein [Nocardioides sp. Leaf307]|uniref:hypothetical protein n=1 Tax=Nocardioides sp. Leaf307 TaxID=1736331 RepID=UPI0012E99BF0|nr:hypothetical protein [Nocardioides sp. Leaf307]